MKNAVLLLFIMAIFTNGQSQIIQLEETDIRFSSKIQKAYLLTDGMVLNVNEEYSGEFFKDPVAFMQQNFDIQSFIKEMGGDVYNYYDVEFRTRKGKLLASFSNKGELLSTNQNFKNVALPRDIAKGLVREHHGWIMTKNNYIAVGDGNGIFKEKYIVRLKKDNKHKTLRLSPDRVMGVAALR
jgi:hypothetical protein